MSELPSLTPHSPDIDVPDEMVQVAPHTYESHHRNPPTTIDPQRPLEQYSVTTARFQASNEAAAAAWRAQHNADEDARSKASRNHRIRMEYTMAAICAALAGLCFILFGVFAMIGKGPFTHESKTASIILLVLGCTVVPLLTGFLARVVISVITPDYHQDHWYSHRMINNN